MVRVCDSLRGTGIVSANVDFDVNGRRFTCIASGCMMWRFVKDEKGYMVMRPTGEKWSCDFCEGTGLHKGEPCTECEGEGKGVKHAAIGYCGLAGNPLTAGK
ncbi:MAG: hypothetical protein M0Z52_07395 [Actinomycetota bacterium]|nr:hypothetical protein [Actinomycetota bacterium]